MIDLQKSFWHVSVAQCLLLYWLLMSTHIKLRCTKFVSAVYDFSTIMIFDLQKRSTFLGGRAPLGWSTFDQFTAKFLQVFFLSKFQDNLTKCTCEVCIQSGLPIYRELIFSLFVRPLSAIVCLSRIDLFLYHIFILILLCIWSLMTHWGLIS